MGMDRRAFLGSSSKVLSAGLLAAGMPAAVEAANQPQTAKRKYRLVATEEAFSIPEQADEFRRVAGLSYSNPDLDMWRGFLNPTAGAPPLLRRLLDFEGERIQIMVADVARRADVRCRYGDEHGDAGERPPG